MSAYQPYIPRTISELKDQLAGMMLDAPTFKDRSGYFPQMGIETEFFALNEGLKNIRRKVGEKRYEALLALSHRMRAHFEADPENKSNDTIAGRELIHAMEDILAEVSRRRPRNSE
jgi:hypothetical protein